MPVKDKLTKEGKWLYKIRPYIHYEDGTSKQTTIHGNWIGLEGKREATKLENYLSANVYPVGVKWDKVRQDFVLLNNEICVVDENITFKTLRKLYEKYKNGKVDADGFAIILNKLDLHFISSEGNMKIKDYTKIQYSIWQEKMLKKTYQRSKALSVKKYSLNFLNDLHGLICTLFNFAINDLKIIKDNIPLEVGGFGSLKERQIAKKEKKWNIINYDGYLKLMNYTENDNVINCLFDLSFSNGLRPGEVRAFRWCDYDYTNSRLFVAHTLGKSRTGNGWYLKEPKTLASKDYIPLDDKLNEKLYSLYVKQKQQSNFSDEWYIFGNEKPISEKRITRAITKYIKETKLSDEFRPYDFRHSFASWLISMKFPITYVSQRMRHSSINETLKTYSHLFEEDYLYFNKMINKLKQDQEQDREKMTVKESHCFS